MSSPRRLVFVLSFIKRMNKHMTYENQPNYVDETPGKKFYCTCGESAKNLIVMAPTKCLTRENHL